MTKFLLTKTNLASKFASFYVLPKIHKTPVSFRPITPNIGCVTEAAAKVADHFLQEHARKGQGYIRNSYEVITKLKERSWLHNDKPVSLITGDVEKLYPSIPIKLAKKVLNILQGLYPKLEPVIKLACLVLDNTVVTVGNQTYLQIDGLATGSPIAPTVANLVLNYLENKIITIAKCNKVDITYFRYIDDIFVIHLGDMDSIEEIINKLTNMEDTLKISWKKECVSNNSTNKIINQQFLDLNISYNYDTQEFTTSPYQKQINSYQYLPFNSCHPRSVKKSWIQAEIERYRRLSSKTCQGNELVSMFYTRLRNRGYPANFLNNIFQENIKKWNTKPKNILKTVYLKLQHDNSYVMKSNWGRFLKTSYQNPKILTRVCKLKGPSLEMMFLKNVKKTLVTRVLSNTHE